MESVVTVIAKGMVPKEHRQPKNLRTLHWQIHDNTCKEMLRDAVLSTAHFQNQLILLVGKNYDAFKAGHEPNLHNLLLNKRILRALVAKTNGGVNAAKVQFVLDHYAHNPSEDTKRLFAEFLVTARQLKEKNLAQTTGNLQGAYRSYYTKLRKGDPEARPPKPHKLSRMVNYAMPIDQCAWSLKRKNLLRLNLYKKMHDFQLNHKKLIQIVGNLNNVQSISVVWRHEEIYFSLSYYQAPPGVPVLRAVKEAGLDLGVKNIASIFVADRTTPSLVISGTNLQRFNSRNNRRIAKAVSQRDLDRNALSMRMRSLREEKQLTYLSEHEAVDIDTEYASLHAKYLLSKALVAKQYSDRYKSFKDTMHKMATRILEYLALHGVTHLYVSRNLGEAKQGKGLSRKFNKKFHPVPLIKLIDYLQLKGAEYGIAVNTIDEAYTSRCSCLHGDAAQAQSLVEGIEEKEKRTEILRKADVFKGRRVERDIYRDAVCNIEFHADLNGAANHIVVGSQCGPLTWLIKDLWKLQNPILIAVDSLYLDGKLLDFIRVETGEVQVTNYHQLRDVHRASHAAKFLQKACHVQVCSG